MKKEINIFLTALMFYTRIPCPRWVDHSAEYLNISTKYFPLVGWIVGAVSGLTFFLLNFVLPVSVSLALSMLAGIFITGGFHEDGLADTCDAFGGGWTKEKILAIMKDSRVGAFGVIGLVMTLLVKFIALLEIAALTPKFDLFLMNEEVSQWLFMPSVLIAGNSLSRFAAATVIYTHQYVRSDGNSKAKPVAEGKAGFWALIVMAIFGMFPLVLLNTWWAFVLIIPVLLVRQYLAGYFKKWIGGYTGDCLGAVQQISEVVFYLMLIILWKLIW